MKPRTGTERMRHKIRECSGTAALAAVIVCALAGKGAAPLSAQEASAGFTLYPSGTLPINGHIIATGSKEAVHRLLRTLEQRDPLAPQLVSGGDTVQLTAVKMLEGNAAVTQLVLAPVHPLTPGTSYRLSAAEPFLSGTEGTEKAVWFVRDQVDSIPPEWSGPAAYIGGCHRQGLSHYAYVALPLADASLNEIAVEVAITIVGERNDKGVELSADTVRLLLFPRTDIVEEFSGAILISDNVVLQLDPDPQGQRVHVADHQILPIGDGRAYGGGIAFEAGQTYRVTMTAIDAAGNRSPARAGIIRVPGETIPPPTKPDKPTAGATATELKQEPPPRQRNRTFIPVFEEVP